MKRSFAAGRYEVVDTLGRGGMGEVLAVRIVATGGRAALKTMRADRARSEARLERFRREAAVLGTLEHPHIVRSFDFGVEDDGTAFVVMELLDGASMHDEVKRNGPMSVARAARLLRQVASALHAAHEAGVVHRDIKPSNVMIVKGYDGREMAKVVDFGIASVGEAFGADLVKLTATGQMVGTPTFMAPEQLAGEHVTPRTDVYALGALAYAVLAGRPPYSGDDTAELLGRVLRGDRAPLRVLRPEVGPLAMLIDRAMAIRPEDRFTSAHELALALRRYEQETLATRASPAAASPPSGVPASVSPPAAADATERAAEPKRRGVPMAALGITVGAVAAILGVGAVAILVASSNDDPLAGPAAPPEVVPVVPLAVGPAGQPVQKDARAPAVEPSVEDAGTSEPDGAVPRRRRRVIVGQHAPERDPPDPPPQTGSRRYVVITVEGDRPAFERLILPNRPRFEACIERDPSPRPIEVSLAVGVTTAPSGEPLSGTRSVNNVTGYTESIHDCIELLIDSRTYRGASFDTTVRLLLP